MSVPTWAGFVAYFPDDEVATGHEIAVYGGRNVAIAVGEVFAGLGCSHVSDPRYGGDVGWDFGFRCDRHSFWCRVQSFHPIYWLLLEGPSGRRGASAHQELWRKFADALEQDPRFDQILWRSFKEGPPDWDEFTVTDNLPERAILEELPLVPQKPRPKAAGGSLAPAMIGTWCALAVVVFTVIGAAIHGAKEQGEYGSLAMAALVIGLAVTLRVIDRHRRADRSPKDSAP